MDFTDKFFHYETAKELGIPVAEGKVVLFDNVVDYAEELGFPVYISGKINVGGSNSIVAHDPRMFHSKHKDNNAHYLVTKYVPECRTVSISGVISKNQVYISAFHEKWTDGSTFTQALYPMQIASGDIREIEESLMFARKIGNRMRELGFRGICGWNFIFKEGEVYFTNFIPKPQCTWRFTETALKFQYPDQILLRELGRVAKAEEDFPKDLKGLGFIPSQFRWSYENKDYM